MDMRGKFFFVMWQMKLRFMFIVTFFLLMMLIRRHNQRKLIRSRTFQNHATRLQYLDSIIGNSDIQCVNQLRMDRRTFGLLCELLRVNGGLRANGSVTIEEQVCMFLHTLSHHVKNRTIGSRFFRSGETVSRYFNSVLNGVLRLHDVLLRAPEPVPENCTDERWKWFKNCLGALDGTYIKVRVGENDKPRYRTRKGEIATNVLGVCSRDMKFIFVMLGWEGSASDSRVLRDALSKPTGLKVPTGMESGGSSHITGNKTGSRRAWTKEEEEKMLNILDALVANGSRADNGTFKSGSYKYIENELEKLQPGCGLKAYPHIDSKIRIWKKNYGVLFDMLNTSGFGWNDVRKCVEVDSDEVWKSYVESHKEAINWRNKPFPYYERLANIFGKDHATGRSAETPIDMANAALQEEIHDDNEIDDEGSPMFASPSANSQDTTRSRPQSSHKKRSKSDEYVVDGIEKLVSAFHQANTDMSHNMYGSSEDHDYIAEHRDGNGEGRGGEGTNLPVPIPDILRMSPSPPRPRQNYLSESPSPPRIITGDPRGSPIPE